MRHPERGPWELHIDLQSHEPTNAVFLNGHSLGYLPMKDWTYSWVSTSFSVPGRLLRPGYNELTIQAGYVAPQLQGLGTTWDDVLFRDIFLARVAADSLSSDTRDRGNAGGTKILQVLKETGGAEREIIAERLEISLSELERAIATLRHMEKVRVAN